MNTIAKSKPQGQYVHVEKVDVTNLEELCLQIALRIQLRNQMVGQLYPVIVTDEIVELLNKAPNPRAMRDEVYIKYGLVA